MKSIQLLIILSLFLFSCSKNESIKETLPSTNTITIKDSTYNVIVNSGYNFGHPIDSVFLYFKFWTTPINDSNYIIVGNDQIFNNTVNITGKQKWLTLKAVEPTVKYANVKYINNKIVITCPPFQMQRIIYGNVILDTVLVSCFLHAL